MTFHSSFVLHTYPWRETSLIVELFTEDEGRVSAVAKGARRRTSSVRGVLMPFNKLSTRYSNKGELRSLMAAEWDEKGKKLLSGKRIFAGFYINELVLKIIQKSDSCKGLFCTYESTLKDLALLPELQEVHLRKFEFALLKEIGVLPDFSSELKKKRDRLFLTPGQGILAETDIHEPESSLGSNFFPIEVELLNILQTLGWENDYWNIVFREKKYWAKIKALLRFLLDGQLNSIEIKSRRIMKEIQQFTRET